jgi:hypothetical protein
VKILYAAGNREGSYYQLKRFIASVNKKHIIKTAAYKITNIDIDYNLNALLNITSPNSRQSFNGNYSYYRKEIEKFSPDLIISDSEIYSSVLANELKIKLWQFSPLNIYYGLDPKIKPKIPIHKNYLYLIESNEKRKETKYILNNADRRFVLSHLCDCKYPPPLVYGFEYVRPSFILGDGKTNIDNLIILSKTNKNIIHEYKNKSSVLFSNSTFERYNKMVVEDIDDEIAYQSYLDGCKNFITDGTGAFLADAFYNQKFSNSIPKYDDIESIICSLMNEYCGVGKIGLSDCGDIDIVLNDKVKFLSEHLG